MKLCCNHSRSKWGADWGRTVLIVRESESEKIKFSWNNDDAFNILWNPHSIILKIIHFGTRGLPKKANSKKSKTQISGTYWTTTVVSCCLWNQNNQRSDVLIKWCIQQNMFLIRKCIFSDETDWSDNDIINVYWSDSVYFLMPRYLLSGGIFDGCDYAQNMDLNHVVQMVGLIFFKALFISLLGALYVTFCHHWFREVPRKMWMIHKQQWSTKKIRTLQSSNSQFSNCGTYPRS